MSRDDATKGERDGFWEIDKLIPKRHRVALPRFSDRVALSPVADEVSPTPSSPPDRRLTVYETVPRAEVQVRSYAPEGNPLLHKVTVHEYVGGHSFYEQFLRDGERYLNEPGIPCAYTPFFSFTPQYNQLSREQLSYYFYLRSEVRAGRYPRADKGYFFLLVYEIVNLHRRIPPSEGSRLLAELWSAYRGEIDGLDRYMIPWLADYCLFHGLPCPRELSSDCLSAAGECDGAEFYLGTAVEATPEGVLRLVALSSDYRFLDSRAITEENRVVFQRHMTGAMERVFSYLFTAGIFSLSDRPERLRRRAFLGSLCSHNVRAELEIEYISLRRSEGWRRIVTLAVKYTENRLRAALGIRARLAASELPREVRAVIDRYFDAVRATAPRPPAAAPAYEKLYDAPECGIDVASAKRIEASSWELTRRLVPEEEPADSPLAPPPTPAPTPEATAPPSLFAAVTAFLSGGKVAETYARHRGLPLPLLAEEVNEAFLAAYGDVLLEPTGMGYAIIEDYLEDAQEWLKTLQN